MELTNEQRMYPTPPKDDWVTEYQDGTKLSGTWATRLDEWKKFNLHRIPKPEYILTKQEEQKPAKDSPEGLFGKYVISRSDGSPIDPENEYFVLKLKGDGDPIHMEACTKAVLTYAEKIRNHLPLLANDLLKRYGPFVKLEQPQANDVDEKYLRLAKAYKRRKKEIQSLKQDNAELVEILKKTMMYRPPKDWREGYNLAKAYLEKLDKQRPSENENRQN